MSLPGVSEEEAGELDASFSLYSRSKDAFARLDLRVDLPVQDLELVLHPAPSRRVEFVDPEGRPLAGVLFFDGNPGTRGFPKRSDPLPEAHATIRGTVARMLVALHPGAT